MTDKITLNNVVTFQNDTTAVNTINGNNATIVAAFDNTLSRDGTAPNQMLVPIDMNNEQILNLPPPITPQSPLRLQDLTTFNGGGTISTLPVGGTTGQTLAKQSNTNYDVFWSNSGSGTVSSVGLSMPAEFTVTNSPVTATGTLTATKANQNANLVYAGPSTGSPAAPTFRALAAADMPALTLSGDVSGSASGGTITTAIGANKVTNAMHATQADATIKSNISGSTSTPSDNSITSVLDKQLGSTQGSVAYRNAATWTSLAPGTNGQVLTSAGAAANPSWTTATGTGTVTNIATASILTGGAITTTGTLSVNATLVPEGRLTLSTLTPVLTSTVSAATAVLYTPYLGNLIPIYDGSNMVPTAFSELTNTLSDATKNPAAAAANSTYDLFVWNDSGTIRLSRGPVWTNVQTRSAGTAIGRTNGILLNTVSITNGPAANRGTYVGTISTNGTSTVDFIYGTAASGGGAAFFGLWNMYNRVNIGTDVSDNGAGYTYTTATIRQARASAGNQVSFVQGLQEDAVWASYGSRVSCASVATATANIGMAMNSSTTFSGQYAQVFNPVAALMAAAVSTSKEFFSGVLGLNVLFANEQGDGSNANTFNSATSATLSARIKL